MTVRVLIADDSAMVRSGFRMILDAQPDIRVVGEAADGDRALELTRLVRPDVVLADIRMPGLDGLELTRRLAGSTRVIVVTTYDMDDYIHEALRGGACGFLLKRSGPTLMIEAIRAAMTGDMLISPQITLRLLRDLGARTARRPDEPLTARERDVVRLLAQGRTNAEIAAALFISTATVKTHVASIGRKVSARNRVGIAAWAWDTGYGREP
ncbi:response regulator transcription factor [Actinomadura barringtoniae]|uniref:Response regulator transcription factor n=1 Tax=Actinomadura barringtoniae TaxID=1427535 RepID=A0A939PID1_9ACTN|nr:response regulator transcription factor [Actinomadura barringtoniae]MBO2453462.1 response regulator transcription factor [Actinomadura barringtoniae]